MEEEYFQCYTCHETVPVPNRTVHEIGCIRRKQQKNFADASSVTPKSPSTITSEVEESNIESDLCNVANEDIPGHSIETLSTYEGNTISSTAECEFCEIPISLAELDDHVYVCGSRTDVCEACLSYVRIRDMRRHRDSNCTSLATSTQGAFSEHRSSEQGPLLGERRTPTGILDSIQTDDTSSWTPVVAALGAAAAAAAVGVFMRRR